MPTARVSNITSYITNKCENVWGPWSTLNKFEHVQNVGALYVVGTPCSQNDWRTDMTETITFSTLLADGK